ncbi:MAG TPA: hypothetical protein VGF24_06800 [Vicinamibacterales bacterium]|jgi:hypothetical protein
MHPTLSHRTLAPEGPPRGRSDERRAARAGRGRDPLDEDHVSICKPPDRNAPLYKSLKRFVAEVLATTTGEALPARPVDLTGEWVAEVTRKNLKPYPITREPSRETRSI